MPHALKLFADKVKEAGLDLVCATTAGSMELSQQCRTNDSSS